MLTVCASTLHVHSTFLYVRSTTLSHLSAGPAGWKIASALTARHIGGAVNYLAVAEMLEIPPSVFGGLKGGTSSVSVCKVDSLRVQWLRCLTWVGPGVLLNSGSISIFLMRLQPWGC